jgi:hypothetical protein
MGCLYSTRTGQSPGTVDCPFRTESRRSRRIVAVDGKGEPAIPPRIAQAQGPPEWYEDATENAIDAEACSAGDLCAQPAPVYE